MYAPSPWVSEARRFAISGQGAACGEGAGPGGGPTPSAGVGAPAAGTLQRGRALDAWYRSVCRARRGPRSVAPRGSRRAFYAKSLMFPF